MPRQGFDPSFSVDSDVEDDQAPIRRCVVTTTNEIVVDKTPDYLISRFWGPGTYFVPIHTEKYPNAIIWCDESGIDKMLPENFIVKAVFELPLPIFGHVVVTGINDNIGNALPVPQDVVDAILACK